MTHTVYSSGTVVTSPWLNDVDASTYFGTNISGINAVNPKELQFGAIGDGTTDDKAALQAAIDYCLAHGIKSLYSDGTFAISGPLDISNFANGFTFTLGGLVTTSSFPAVSGNWKTGATPMIRLGNTGGSQVGLIIKLGLADGGNKADVFSILNNGCGGSQFYVNYLRNVNIGVKITNNSTSTASNKFSGGYWLNGKQAAYILGTGGICEGTEFDVNFITGFIYGGLNFGERTQYACVRGQLDFNGSWLSELKVPSITGFAIGNTVTSGGQTGEVLATYTYQGSTYLLVIETKDVSGGNSNFVPAVAITGGAGSTTITSIRTVNQSSSAFYFDIISSITSAAPFWRALILCPYVGGMVGNLIWNATVDFGNSNSTFTSWFSGLQVYNSGTTVSLTDKRGSDTSFLDVTDDIFAVRRRLFMGANQFLGLEVQASVPVATPTTLVTLSAGGATNGSVWAYILQDSTAGIFAKGTVRIPASSSTATLLSDVGAVNCSVAMSGLNLQITQGTGATRSIYINIYRLI